MARSMDDEGDATRHGRRPTTCTTSPSPSMTWYADQELDGLYDCYQDASARRRCPLYDELQRMCVGSHVLERLVMMLFDGDITVPRRDAHVHCASHASDPRQLHLRRRRRRCDGEATDRSSTQRVWSRICTGVHGQPDVCDSKLDVGRGRGLQTSYALECPQALPCGIAPPAGSLRRQLLECEAGSYSATTSVSRSARRTHPVQWH